MGKRDRGATSFLMSRLTVEPGTIDDVYAIFKKHGVDRVVTNQILSDMLSDGIVIRVRKNVPK